VHQDFQEVVILNVIAQKNEHAKCLLNLNLNLKLNLEVVAKH
jgi:hypothetical protein